MTTRWLRFHTAPTVLQYCVGLGALSTQATAADIGTLNELPTDAVTCDPAPVYATTAPAQTVTCTAVQLSGAAATATSALALASVLAMWL